jgi:hypothetical protein
MSETCNVKEVMHILKLSCPKFHVSRSSGSTTPKHSHKYSYLHNSSFSVLLFYVLQKDMLYVRVAYIFKHKTI